MYVRHIRQWQAAGYRVELYYLWVRSVQLAIARVRARVAQGGHQIPAQTVRQRFRQGWKNYQEVYRPLVNHWELYDNTDIVPVLLEQGDRI